MAQNLDKKRLQGSRRTRKTCTQTDVQRISGDPYREHKLTSDIYNWY